MLEDSEESLARDAARDPAAMSRLLYRQSERLQWLIRRNLPMSMDKEIDPQDVLQDIYVRVIAHFETFHYRGHGSFHRWISRIARNYIVNLKESFHAARRHPPKNAPFSQDEASMALLHLLSRGEKSPRQLAADREALLLMHRAMARLPAAEFEVVQLRYLEGREVESVAKLMNRTPHAVHQLTYRALKGLRRALKSST